MKCPQCFFTDQPVGDETCRRCSRNITRAELFDLVVLGLAYVMVCRFSYYLFTGDYFHHILRGGIHFPVTMSEMFLHPINVVENPWHVLTVGWTFALVLLIPIMVGLFYGPVPGMIIAFAGGWYVVAPFYFALSMLSALISGTRARSVLQQRAALLAALLPPLVYLLALTSGAVWKTGLAAWTPWMVALLVVAVSFVVVLAIARRRDHSVRFLPWMTAAQFGIILVLFYSSIGFSKVEYEFLRQEHWAAGAQFAIPVLVKDARNTTAQEREAVTKLYERRRAEALAAFSRFISWFPRYPETAQALFERAELENMRPFFVGSTPDQLQVYTDRIAPESFKDYQTIRSDFPTTLVAVEARLRSARYCLQHAQFEQGVRGLRELGDDCDLKVPRGYRPSSPQSILLRWRSHRLSEDEETLVYYEVLQETRSDLRFIEENSDYSRIPLQLYYQLDMHDPSSDARLREILKWFPDCKLADNIKLLLLERRAYAAAELKALLDEYPAGDAAPRMLLLLGSLYREQGNFAEAGNALRRLATEFPKSPEAQRGAVLLREMK